MKGVQDYWEQFHIRPREPIHLEWKTRPTTINIPTIVVTAVATTTMVAIVNWVFDYYKIRTMARGIVDAIASMEPPGK